MRKSYAPSGYTHGNEYYAWLALMDKLQRLAIKQGATYHRRYTEPRAHYYSTKFYAVTKSSLWFDLAKDADIGVRVWADHHGVACVRFYSTKAW